MKNILLVYGGDSVESDISVLTGLQMYHFLDKTKYNVIPCYIRHGMLHTFKGKKFLKPSFYAKFDTYKYTLNLCHGAARVSIGSLITKYIRLDCALLCTHGASGENGGLQGMLELYEIPYTSCGIYQSSVCMDKWRTFTALSRLNIKTPKTLPLVRESLFDAQELYDQFEGCVIVKPNSLGSSIGVTSPKSSQALVESINLAFSFDDKVLIQQKITNLIELNCAVFMSSNGIVVSEIERVVTANDILNFDDKYLDSGKLSGNSRELPAKIDEKLAIKIKNTTIKAYSALEMLGVARFDYLYDSVSHELYVCEINTIPGSLAYYLFEASQYTASDMLDELINVAIARQSKMNALTKSFKSSILNIDVKRGSKRLKS